VKSHPAALDALGKRAQRYQNRKRTEKELDEELIAGALGPDAGLHNELNFNDWTIDEQNEVQQLLEERADLLEVIGIAPGQKPEGVVRLVYENVNGLRAQLGGNDKLEKLRTVLDDLEADIFAMTEHRNNMKHKANRRHGIPQLFYGGESMVRGIWGYNKHDEESKYLDKKSLEGGTGLVAFGEMASCYNASGSGTDPTGLGRWTYMEFRGKDGHCTVIVSGYVPCKNNRDNSGTSYQQHRRYFATKEKRDDEPRARFLADLCTQLRAWKSEGKRLVVCLDANEDVYKDIIGRTLTDHDGLDLVESVHHSTGEKLGATHFRGSRPIDAVWTSKDVTVASACAMPIGYGVGDHRLFVVDLVKESLVGEQPQAIVRPGARRLNSKIPQCLKRYNGKLKVLLNKHRLGHKLEECMDLSLDKPVVKEKMDKVDVVATECMIHAEKKCRKLKCGSIPFSPEASLWIKRTQFYRSLLRFHSGKGRNRGNFKRAARRCKISKPFSLSREEVAAKLRECRAQCNYFRVHGQKYRTQHLNKRLEAARERQDEEAERRILQIMRREKDRAFWRRLNWSLGKRRGSSVSSVQVKDDDGETITYSTQEEVQNVIWSEVHQSRHRSVKEDCVVSLGIAHRLWPQDKCLMVLTSLEKTFTTPRDASWNRSTTLGVKCQRTQ
jgi:exonuclease III